ncbi:MAG: hypothetical protein GY756_22270, partial [bacterium]|nr:hypothetical protein [bacterium]
VAGDSGKYSYNFRRKTESNSEGARGVLNKDIKNPTPGDWVFIIYPDDASGKLSAEITYK